MSAHQAAFADSGAYNGGVGAEEAVAADGDRSTEGDTDGEAGVIADDIVVGEAAVLEDCDVVSDGDVGADGCAGHYGDPVADIGSGRNVGVRVDDCGEAFGRNTQGGDG